ncbi:MAG TPA: DUF4403 family protein [Cyclobacteriaceae bacterium]|nr:DUF4403 family protein [Cyclobacteriaceae bacterium]
MIGQSKKYFVLLVVAGLLIGLGACERMPSEASRRIQLDSTLAIPQSELAVPVFYPVQELEDMVNEKLAKKIIEAKLAINQKDDSLFLSISRFRPVNIEYNGNGGISYSLPIQIDGTVQSKLIGIRFSNKTPITAKIIIHLYSDLRIDRNWNLAPKSRLDSIVWIEEPKLKIAGIKFNLKPKIEKMLAGNYDKITNKLDESARNIINIRRAIEKVWIGIQKPIRINKKVVRVWLKADVDQLNGRFLRRSKDTLMIEAGIMMKLRTTLDSAREAGKVKPLPPFKQKEMNNPGLKVYMLGTIPFTLLNDVVHQVTDTMKFRFKGHEVTIKSSEVFGTADGLAIKLHLRGDVRAAVFLNGTVGFDTVKQKLVIDNFAFDLNSEQSLVQAANWLTYDVIIERIKPYLSLPLDSTFSVIPNLITRGIEKDKIGEMIDIRFSDFSVNIYQHLITTDNIQIILTATGKADVGLQKQVFEKKKPVQ